MAQRVQVILTDDIDGSTAVETVSFALDGVTYEIDLNEAHAKRLRDDFSSWVGHARRAGGRRQQRRRSSGGGEGSRSDLAQIREWGRQHGYQVSDRGRVSRELQEAYDQANG